MKNKNNLVINLVFFFLIIFLTISNIFLLWDKFFKNDIENFYIENVETLVSPHHLRGLISKGLVDDFILIDLREREDYLNGHIIGAINIVPDENLVENFEKLNENSEVIIYCYTHYCMRGKKVGKKLAESGIFVKELGIGFNEWKNFYKIWNYESEWEALNISEYIQVGEEAGFFEPDESDISCSVREGFEC